MERDNVLSVAALGDAGSLRIMCKDRDDPSFGFLNQTDSNGRNFLHIAIENDRCNFLFEALNILSSNPTLLIELICQKDDDSEGNILHRAVQHGNIFILKLLVNAYTRAVSHALNNQETLPWLERDYREFSPLRQSFESSMPTQENIARYLVSVDEHFYRTLGQCRYPMDECSTQMLDQDNISIVFIGMLNGFSQLVKQILTSDLPYALSGDSNETPLHYASKCNEQVSRILLEKHPEIIMNVSLFGKTMLDNAVEDNATWLVRLMLIEKEEARVPWTKACRKLIWHKNKNGDTPLHIAAKNGNIEILKLLIQGYKYALEEETKYCDGADDALITEPWNDEPENDVVGANLFHVQNFEDEVPLILALRNKYDDCGLILSNETFPSTYSISSLTSIYKQSLSIAVQNGCLLSAKKILERVILSAYVTQDLAHRLLDIDIYSPIALGMAIHITKTYPVMQEMVKAKEFEKFLEVLPMFMGENQKDSKTILKEAVERGDEWFVRLTLQTSYDMIRECAPAWQAACENGNVPFLLIFIELCDHDKFIEFCKETKQTPLHHIKLLQHEQYIELLDMPLFKRLISEGDTNGATPLHQAILRGDLELTKALLSVCSNSEIQLRDNSGITPFDLLGKTINLSTTWCYFISALRAIEVTNEPKQRPHYLKLLQRELYVKVLKTPKFQELLNARNSFGTTPLHQAIERCNLEVTKALLTFDDIDIAIKDDNGKTAIDLLEQMVDVSPRWLEVYIELLKKPVFEKLINERDEDGTTRLHRAIQRDNLEVAKVLLEAKGIDVTIKDNNGLTALDLLQKSCGLSLSWGKMCRDIKQDSTVRKLKYLFRKIAFEGMQNTISVVAALVSTITFAAGFTVPGGTDSSDGTPVLAKKSAFLAFSVSNTIAMCCSIMVLFILLGPMMWDPHPSLVYVNLSLTLLLMSLVGTIVAFMTGVYVTMAPKAMWDSIFVIVSCSLALIMACIILLLTYSARSRELLDKLFNRVKSTSQKSARSSSMLVAETSSSPQAEHGIELDGEAGSII